MKLQEIEIFDFKSIKHTKLKFLNNQLCFVGKNESGKSSIIQAISYLNFLDKELNTKLTNKQSDRYTNGYPVISGLFELSTAEYKKLYSIILNYATIKDEQLPKNSDSTFLQLKRWGNGISNLSIIISDAKSYSINITDIVNDKAKFINNFQIELYPIIEYFEDEDLLIEPATIDELTGDERKFETFRRLLYLGGCDDCSKLKNDDINFTTTYLSNIEGKINRILKRHYKQDQSINITIRPAFNNKLNLVVKDKSGLSFSIDERSPGFRYYFSFLINKLYATKKNGKRNLILLLDEPGRGLHPKGSKDLLKTFDEIAGSPYITVLLC